MTDPKTAAPQNEESPNEEIGKPFPQVMLDPSLLLTSRSLQRVTDALFGAPPGSVAIPASFWRAFRSRELPEQVALFWGASEVHRPESLVAEILTFPALVPYESSNRRADDRHFLDTLAHQARDQMLAQTLIEEWDFLTTHSWLASRIKRPFSAFVRAGAVAIEGGREVFDRLTAVTLKKPNQGPHEKIGPKDRLRAVSKWMAVGGASATPFLISSGLATIFNVAAGYFLLFDP